MSKEKTLRERIGGAIVKVGLRVMGIKPATAVTFVNPAWDAVATARWAAKAWLSAPIDAADAPQEILVAVPKGSLAEFNAALVAAGKEEVANATGG